MSDDVVPRLWRLHASRGPDDHGYLSVRGDEVRASRDWDANDAAADLIFVHNRLKIVDLSDGGWQPMSSPDGRFHLIFNGEIYNHIELRDELSGLGHRFRSRSDTEVLLAAFVEWGPAALCRLVGMFALAIYDCERRAVFLARDFFGIKPLLYTQSPRGFVFGSSMRGILEASGMARTLDPTAAFRFLRFGATDDSDDTLVHGVKHLPAAHYMWVSLGDAAATAPVRYWDPHPRSTSDATFEEATSQLRDAFLNSVDIHLRSDVPVGAALSGGVDSSSIVMAMREISGERLDLHTFSFISESPSLSEERWVDIVGAAARATIHKVRPSADDLIADLDELIESQGEPFGSTNVFASRSVFRLAREAGVPVMLDGQGADEMLAGYSSYLGIRLASLLRRGRLVGAARFARAASERWGVSVSDIVSHSGRALLPAGFQGPARSLVRRELVPDWMNADWLGANDVATSARSDRSEFPYLTTDLVESIRNNIPHLLRYEDRNSMVFSVESRLPFLTPDLVHPADNGMILMGQNLAARLAPLVPTT